MKKTIISLLTMVLIITSCKKEEIDNVSPVINSINIAANDTLRNLFTIKIDASDNKSIARVEYYVNDSLITNINAAPYDYQLNTLKLKDGSVTMKAVVYDAEGNKIETTRNLIVQNLLLSLKMGLLNPVPYYVVVSDEKGNILNTATFNSNETKKIIPKEPCEVKSINIVYYYTWFQSTTMAAFIHVKRGSELKLGTFETNLVKSIKLHFKNDLTNFVQLDIGTDLSRYILTSMADTTRNLPATFPYTGDHKLLLQVQTTTGRYYKLFTIKDIESLTVNLSSINIPETKKSQIFPLTGNVFYIITAKTSNDDPLYQYYLSSGTKEYNTNHIDLFYPATYFTKYQTLISHSLLDGSNKIYSNISSGAVPETFSYISAGAQITSSSLTGFKTVFSGTFDHYLAIYRILSQSVVLNVNAPANQNEWILPDLGTAFGNSALNSSNFFLYQLQLKDYQSLNLANNYYALDIERLVAAEDHIQNLTYQVRTK